MSKDDSASKPDVSRRSLLSGVSGLLAATAYSLEVPDGAAAQVTSGDDSDVQTVTSPDGSITVTVDISSGVPEYSIESSGSRYIDASPIGFNFESQSAFGTAVSGSGPDITVTGSESGTTTEQWTPQWGAFDKVAEDYSYLRLGLEETSSPGRSATLEIRVFNDGLGFRLVFDDEFGDFTITSENTEFRFTEDYTAWWIENELVNPRFEQEYSETSLSDIPAGSKRIETDSGESPNGNYKRVGAHTPLTVRASDGTYLSLHEATLEDYGTMTLASISDRGSKNFAAELAPKPDGTKVTASAPHMTPWRTIQIGSSPGDLGESQLVPLLAPERDDSVYPTDSSGNVDTSWITDRKYAGIWWMMIAGSANWEYKSDSEIEANGNDPAQYIHGARTERMKRHMNFASEHGVDSVLVEGWNKGWSGYGAGAEDDGLSLEMGVDDSYPDFDVVEVTDFGQTLDPAVELTIHNETSGNLNNYEDEIRNEDIFTGYEANHIRSIKNGYVSDPGLFGNETDPDAITHNNYCQRAVNHHRLVIEQAAQHRQMLEIHEGIKPTGEIRTYPHVAAREVVKAQEYDGFGELGADVGRDHHVVLPFTRMLAGPTSYQPGIFDVTFNDNTDGRIQTTRAQQLAMYPTYLGGLQMVSDRIEAYIDPTVEVGEFVQAQAGELNGMITADKWRDAYGGHYVPIDSNRVDAGSTVEFTVKDVPNAGGYDLHFRYASDQENNLQAVQDNGNPEATLVVNDTEQNLAPSFTDYWDDWQIHTVSVDLDAGDNIVAIRLGSNDVGGFNLNTVGVSETGVGSPVAATFGNVDPAQENYDTVREFDFLEAVPAGDWDETVVVDASIGDYIVTARRSGDDWFLGAMTDGTARAFEISLDFLSSQQYGWNVTEYTDAPGTDVTTNPTEVEINQFNISAGENRLLKLSAGGGSAMRIRPASDSAGIDDIVSGETYVLRNPNSGKVMDVEYASTEDGANVHQWDYGGGDNQKWVVTDLDNGYYKLEAVHSGKALDVEYASTEDDTNIHQWDYAGGENQQWAIDNHPDGTYTLMPRHSGKLAEVETGSTSDGANVQQWTDSGAEHQRWVLEQP